MISHNLSDLIHQGVAKYYTFCVGATGSCRLPVPDDSYLVITDFHYHHFVDRVLLSPGVDIQEALRDCTHHIRFRSQSESYLYNVRTSFKIDFFDGFDFLMPRVPEVSYDTYQVHTTDVHIDIWRLIDFKAWILNVGKLDNKTVEPAGPLGYGTVNLAPNQNVLRQVDMDGFGTSNYIPYGTNQNLPLTLGWRDQMFSDISNRTFLFPPDIINVDGNYTYPLVNIGYVLVKQPFNRKNK